MTEDELYTFSKDKPCVQQEQIRHMSDSELEYAYNKISPMIDRLAKVGTIMHDEIAVRKHDIVLAGVDEMMAKLVRLVGHFVQYDGISIAVSEIKYDINAKLFKVRGMMISESDNGWIVSFHPDNTISVDYHDIDKLQEISAEEFDRKLAILTHIDKNRDILQSDV